MNIISGIIEVASIIILIPIIVISVTDTGSNLSITENLILGFIPSFFCILAVYLAAKDFELIK